MTKKKMTFALAFCNRGFMPGELIYGAREDMIKAVTDAGYDYIAMDADLTRYGGIETRDEGSLMRTVQLQLYRMQEFRF